VTGRGGRVLGYNFILCQELQAATTALPVYNFRPRGLQQICLFHTVLWGVECTTLFSVYNGMPDARQQPGIGVIALMLLRPSPLPPFAARQSFEYNHVAEDER
jgi:hypothetical protein